MSVERRLRGIRGRLTGAGVAAPTSWKMATEKRGREQGKREERY